MMLIMKRLKILTLPFQMCIAVKPLAAEKLFAIGVVKMFYTAIFSRLTDGNKHRLNAIIKT